MLRLFSKASNKAFFSTTIVTKGCQTDHYDDIISSYKYNDYKKQIKEHKEFCKEINYQNTIDDSQLSSIQGMEKELCKSRYNMFEHMKEIRYRPYIYNPIHIQELERHIIHRIDDILCEIYDLEHNMVNIERLDNLKIILKKLHIMYKYRHDYLCYFFHDIECLKGI